MKIIDISEKRKQKLYAMAFGLAIFTIVYNIAEGVISICLGYRDESLALFGFGADSLIEIISGIGIAHMVLRIWRQPGSNLDDFERTALQVTGFSLYTLVVGLVITSIYDIWTGNKPETTLWGIVIAVVSIVIMLVLIAAKIRIGKELGSEAILADAKCTRVCVYMSVILLISSVVYELTNFGYVDSIGALALSYFAFREGKECFEKAGNDSCSFGHE